jgi:hypothetical protein
MFVPNINIMEDETLKGYIYDDQSGNPIISITDHTGKIIDVSQDPNLFPGNNIMTPEQIRITNLENENVANKSRIDILEFEIEDLKKKMQEYFKYEKRSLKSTFIG